MKDSYGTYDGRIEEPPYETDQERKILAYPKLVMALKEAHHALQFVTDRVGGDPRMQAYPDAIKNLLTEIGEFE